MTGRTHILFLVGALMAALPFLCLAQSADMAFALEDSLSDDNFLAGFESFKPRPDNSEWSPVFSAGYDALMHSYPLATTDTTETISEYVLTAGIEGRSPRKATHKWRLRAEAAVGSELYRQLLEAQYKYHDNNRQVRWRMDGRFYGRQYKDATEYSLSSDNIEGRFDLRAYPWIASRSKLELRGWSSATDFRNPSSLEVDARDLGAGAFLRSSHLGDKMWSVGYRYSKRSYPDTVEINRKIHRIEGDLDFHDENGQGLRLFHKSGRRLIKDETVRPSAWAHWTDFNGLVSAGNGFVFLDVQNEIWQYDEETSVYFDSWRIESALGYRWGDVLKANWQLGLAGERLDAGSSPETYTQFGFRSGVESYASDVSGSLMVEVGRRIYSQNSTSTSGDVFDDDYLTSFYSDFNYWEIWLMANWHINKNFSLDLLANYEPESHTESDDDSSIGFASLRLVWRP